MQARQRVEGRSTNEVGATLQAVRRLMPKGTEKQPVPNDVKMLLFSLKDDLKRMLPEASERSISNSLFTLTSLRFADKQLMMAAVNELEARCVPCTPGIFVFVCGCRDVGEGFFNHHPPST